MLRVYTFLTTILCSAGIVSAQTGTDASLKSRYLQQKSPVAQKLLSKIQAMQHTMDMPAQKATATQKLRAEAISYPGDGTGLRDSIAYIYNGSNGSAFDFNYMEYNNSRYFPSFNEVFVDYDTAHYYITGSPTPLLSKYISYSSSGKALMYRYGDYAVTWVYNGQDQAIATYETEWNSGSSAWDTSYKSYFTYDGQQLVSDSTVWWDGSNWTNEYKDVYSYTSGINVPVAITSSEWNGSNWDDFYRIEVTYTGGAQLETILYQEHNGSGWESKSKDTLGYSNNQRIFQLNYEWNGTAWDLIAEEYRHLNTDNLPDSIFLRDNWSGTGSWDTMYAKVTYNSHGNPVSLTTFDSEMIADEEKFFYYEDISTGVSENITAAQASVTIYPNPVTDQLNVQAGHTSGGRLSYTIINNLGQTMLQAAHTTTTGQAVSIPVQHLTPGIYRIRVVSTDNTVHNIPFLKN